MKPTLYALHGFLGKPSDWDFIKKEHLIQSVDLFNFDEVSSLSEWARRLNQKVAPLNQSARILMGYSLGGRLALHALIDNPSLWTGAIIISCHAGLDCPLKKKERQKNDDEWAHRFETDPWELLMRDWNSQGVFKGGGAAPPRDKADYSPGNLSKALKEWSLARQDDLHSGIEKLQLPILWMTGALDTTYVNLSKSIFLSHRHSSKVSVPYAGHRVPWDQPDIFQWYVKTFLKEIT